MDFSTSESLHSNIRERIVPAANYIASCQRDDGGIVWFEGGHLDPWDHTEAAMGLTIAGEYERVQKAFEWLLQNQNLDGSWFARYYGDEPIHKDHAKIDTNFVAYPATGLWHYYLITQDIAFVKRMFPIIARGITYVLQQQTPEGDIQWALSKKEILPKDALITACCSILRSLECAIQLAELVNYSHHWKTAYRALADALTNKPWRFDRTWEPKTRFSMDWFYPVLSGVHRLNDSRRLINKRWDEFVNPTFGCRCVNDEPWVTIAESCELTLALMACRRNKEARKLFETLLQWQDDDGGFWTGYSFRDEVIWPNEKTSWTAGAALLAIDALEQLTPASTLFTQPSRLLSA